MSWRKLLFLGAIFAIGADLGRARDQGPPNIVMVLVDDMGWGDWSCFGNREMETPQIDRMAAEGLRFGQFYVASPICSPSRCGIVTGQYPQRWRITSFLENRESNQRRGMAQWLDPTAPTMARLLQARGYATGHFGKWHLGGQRDVTDAPAITSYGYDRSLTNFEGRGAKLLPLTRSPENPEARRLWADAERLGGPVTWMNRSEITAGFVEAAMRFMDEAESDGKPFYVNIWPDDVHSPYWPPLDQWASGKKGLYQQVLKNMDRQLGKLFDFLERRPSLRDNTLVFLLSDNGPEMGAGTAGPLSGGKGELLEGGIRSPLIIWGPGWIHPEKAGSRDDESVFWTLDFVPSLLTLTGTPEAPGLVRDGEDFSLAMLGKGRVKRQKPLFWRRPPDRGNLYDHVMPDLAIREGEWKLLCALDGSQRRLFHLSEDPAEARNVAQDHPDLAQRLADLVLAWNQSLPVDAVARQWRDKQSSPGE